MDYISISLTPEVKTELDEIYYSLRLKNKIKSRCELIKKFIKLYKRKEENKKEEK